ncbi:hypothetical protein ACLB2K_040551 [Fragaria x ananassa]
MKGGAPRLNAPYLLARPLAVFPNLQYLRRDLRRMWVLKKGYRVVQRTPGRFLITRNNEMVIVPFENNHEQQPTETEASVIALVPIATEVEALSAEEAPGSVLVLNEAQTEPKKKRGRPIGSKNKKGSKKDAVDPC